MRELGVYIEINGERVPVGKITGQGPADACFAYDADYPDRAGARPISLHLPFTGYPFTPEETGSFFDGLLPEGFTRRSVAQWMRIDENDYLSILSGLGRECLGAIQILEKDEIPEPASYRKLSHDQIRKLAAEGATRSARMVTEAHLSLTGASGKVGLYRDPGSGEWYLPSGDAPSTHIVKQSHVRLGEIVLNERMTMMTAAGLGIEVPESFIVNTGEGREQDVLFATARYDRDVFSPREVSGLRCPYRRHQEDLAQALGAAAGNKYERQGGHYFLRMGELLRLHSSEPIRDILRLWDLTVFNWLIGNTDNHIKNHSLLYSPDLQSVRLAPAYDLISTVVYEGSSRNMAFNIGGQYRIEEITAESWQKAASEIGIRPSAAMDRIRRMTQTLPEALEQSAETLRAEGAENAHSIKEQILRHGGICSAEKIFR